MNLQRSTARNLLAGILAKILALDRHTVAPVADATFQCRNHNVIDILTGRPNDQLGMNLKTFFVRHIVLHSSNFRVKNQARPRLVEPVAVLPGRNHVLVRDFRR